MKKWVIFLALVIVVLIFYGGVLNTWFQQDEWDWLGRYYYYNSISKIPFWEAFKSSLFPHPRYRFTPLFDAAYAAQVYFFGLNFTPYVALSLLLHTLNGFLVFLLAKKLTKDDFASFLAGVFFVTSGVGQKAVTWVFTSTNTAVAAVFSMTALLAFLNKRSYKILFLLVFIALWFKETAIVLLFLLPLLAIIKKDWRSFKKTLLKSGVFGLSYFALRIVLAQVGAQIHTEGYPSFGRFLTFSEYFQIAIWSPARSVVNAFAVPESLQRIGRLIIPIFWPKYRGLETSTEFGLLSESQGVDLATALLTPMIIYLLYKTYKDLPKNQKSGYSKTYFLSLTLIISSAFISLLLSIRGTSALVHVIRSRDLYLSITGSAIALALLIRFLKTKWLAYTITGLYLIYNWNYINKTVLPIEINKAQLRKPIVELIYSEYPKLPKKVIFYTESDTPYYGSETPSMPFQTGFGRTLLVWYLIKNQDIPPEFAQADWLFYQFDEGYREIGNFGFGYFWHLNNLESTLKKYGLKPESVIAFSYQGGERKLTDITALTRQKLKENYEKVSRH